MHRVVGCRYRRVARACAPPPLPSDDVRGVAVRVGDVRWLRVGDRRAYARCFTKEETDDVLIDWIVSLCISFLLTEPVQIVLIACLPCIFKQDWVQATSRDI